MAEPVGWRWLVCSFLWSKWSLALVIWSQNKSVLAESIRRWLKPILLCTPILKIDIFVEKQSAQKRLLFSLHQKRFVYACCRKSPGKYWHSSDSNKWSWLVLSIDPSTAWVIEDKPIFSTSEFTHFDVSFAVTYQQSPLSPKQNGLLLDWIERSV